MDTLVGRQLGKYRIETLLGRGGMAAVYKAQDTVLNRAVAIKVLEPALAVDPRAVERFRREAVLTATGQVMGTADYLAPEQISGRPAGPRSDVYSLGVILYEMLTGVTPFAGETTASILYRQVHDNPVPLRSVNPRLPVELQPVVDRALAKNPALRYSDPLDLATELQEVARWLPSGSPWIMAGGPQPMPP